jgi:hypothetical protein
VTWRDTAVLLVYGFLLRSAIDVVLEWRANRPRRFNIVSDYFDPCGSACKARRMSEIGAPLRVARSIHRFAQRFHARLRASGPMRAKR